MAMWKSPHENGLSDTERKRLNGILWDERNALGNHLLAKARKGVPKQRNGPLLQRSNLCEQLQQRCLPGTVRADDAQHLSCLHREVHIVKNPRRDARRTVY